MPDITEKIINQIIVKTAMLMSVKLLGSFHGELYEKNAAGFCKELLDWTICLKKIILRFIKRGNLSR